MLFNKKTSYTSGLIAELFAKLYLRLHGFKILKSRFITGKNTGRAEIDIIANRGNLIIFVEVKRRKNITLAFNAISPKQINRMRLSAEHYIRQKRWIGDARFDVIAICGSKIHHIKNAF